MKNLKILLLVVCAVFIAALATPIAEVQASEDMVIVYVQVPEDWEAPGAWAWGPRGDAFPSWPGGAFQADPNNPGWYFIHLPADKTGALINANDGSIQTSDFPFEGVPVWVTVNGPGEDFDVTTDQQTTGAFPEYIPTAAMTPIDLVEDLIDAVVVYAYIPEGWELPGMWAWGPRGNAFDEWPGEGMNADANNPGWYYGFLPADKVGALINANNGDVQTSDFPFEGAPVWVVIETDGEEVTFNVYTDPLTSGALPTREPFVALVAEVAEVPDAGYITVHAMVPFGWDGPGVWAWNNDIGSVFPGWPGQPFDTMDGDWHVMEIPAWVNEIIINAQNGGLQTDDIEIEPGRDIWILVSGSDENFELSYYPIEGAEVAAPVRNEPVRIEAETPVEDTPAPANDGGSNTVLIIIIVAVVVVVLAVGAFIIIKKKK